MIKTIMMHKGCKAVPVIGRTRSLFCVGLPVSGKGCRTAAGTVKQMKKNGRTEENEGNRDYGIK